MRYTRLPLYNTSYFVYGAIHSTCCRPRRPIKIRYNNITCCCCYYYYYTRAPRSRACTSHDANGLVHIYSLFSVCPFAAAAACTHHGVFTIENDNEYTSKKKKKKLQQKTESQCHRFSSLSAPSLSLTLLLSVSVRLSRTLFLRPTGE